MRHSLYWDNFEIRAKETAIAIKNNSIIPIRRIAVFITQRCNLHCSYCKHIRNGNEMTENTFANICDRHKQAIIHITGGEPSVVDWLYPYIIDNSRNYTFHLNTNAYICPPSKHVKRLKISLDSCDENYFNKLVGAQIFKTVINNIKSSIDNTVVSITYTMTKENYRGIPKFIEYAKKEFSGLYAIFFSIYKGNNLRFIFDEPSVIDFYNNILPIMKNELDEESKALLNETISTKLRIIQGIRFPENINNNNICYLSLSERAYDCDGIAYGCSHLFRDNIKIEPGTKHSKCIYGCNGRLVDFNNEVTKMLAGKNVS